MTAEAAAADEYLQETLFGSKEPVSISLLSFQLGQTLTEAAHTLLSFYESHRETLDASFTVKIQEESKLCVKIISAKDLNESVVHNSRIWIVSSENATDKAVMAAVSAKVRNLQKSLSVGRLKRLGLVTNPLLENDFPTSANPTVLTESPVPTETLAPPSKAELGHENSVPKQPVESRTASSERKPPQTEKPLSEPKQTTTRSATPSKKGVGFFTKSTKEEALKSMRTKRSEFKPVHEAVVISDEVKDEKDEYEEELSKRGDTREAQIQRLRESMLQEEEESQSDEDIDDTPNPDDLGDYIAPSATDEMGIDDQLPNTSEVADRDRQSTDASEIPESNLHHVAASSAKPQTRRVRRNVIRKDEEGFDVHEEIWVDEPIEYAGEVLKPDSASIEAPNALEPTKQPKPEPTQRTNTTNLDAKQETDSKRVAKAPPKLSSGQKKQKTLMSFFGKK